MTPQDYKSKRESLGYTQAQLATAKNEDKKMKAKYRIVTSDRRIKFVGTDMPSWFTLDQAREIVSVENGEMIY